MPPPQTVDRAAKDPVPKHLQPDLHRPSGPAARPATSRIATMVRAFHERHEHVVARSIA